MNTNRWSQYQTTSLDTYMTKLTEEVGEVASELSDLHEKWDTKEKAYKRLSQMSEELDQVMFIARYMQARVRQEQRGLFPGENPAQTRRRYDTERI